MNGYIFYLNNIIQLFTHRSFKGWGRKRTGRFAQWCQKRVNGTLTLQEDGFIRSLNLGINGSPSFSLVKDDLGIYYDATTSSKLEQILNTYDFQHDTELMRTAYNAITLIKQYHISKYNDAPLVDDKFCQRYDLNLENDNILIIAQTAGDASLEYGMLKTFTIDNMIDAALSENPDADIYLKIHPDALTGKKTSDINLDQAREKCIIINENSNPISLLKYFDKVYTKTSGMGMEALLCGCECVCFGMPYYAGWGITDDRVTCDRRTRKLSIEEVFAGAYILYTHYYNPYTQKESNLIDTIQTINKYREIEQKNMGNLYFFGFSRWKRAFIKPFFYTSKKNNLIFSSNLQQAIHTGLDSNSKVYIWGKKPFPEVEAYAKEHHIPLFRVEDGFVRSVSLGSDLTKAYSLVVDSRGIYFDPTVESDLEHLLNTYTFEEDLIERSKKLQHYLIENKISKYNADKDIALNLNECKENQKVVMVPGQVEDDASIIYGADEMSNLELLKQARNNAPDAYIIYKPHPDVLAGNRKGNIPEDEALQYCNAIIKDASLDSVLEVCDEIHTMTSLVGFEGLIRGKTVYTYGLPFYAGWGLTHDAKKCERRIVNRSLDELTAATFVLYPRYIHPKTNELCEVEVLLEEIDKEKSRYNSDKLYKLYIDTRNMISRKIQLLIKVILGE